MSVIIKGDALERVKNAARICGVPADRLPEVLMKGIKIIELSSQGKVMIDRASDRLTLDLTKL